MITIYLLLVPGAKHVLERHAIKFIILIIGLGFKRVHKVSIVGYTRYTAAYKRIAECFRTRDIFSMWFTVWSFGVPTIIFYYAHHTDHCGPSYRFLPLFQLLSARLCDEAVPTLYCSSVITLAVMVRIAVSRSCLPIGAPVELRPEDPGWVTSDHPGSYYDDIATASCSQYPRHEYQYTLNTSLLCMRYTYYTVTPGTHRYITSTFYLLVNIDINVYILFCSDYANRDYISRRSGDVYIIAQLWFKPTIFRKLSGNKLYGITPETQHSTTTIH